MAFAGRRQEMNIVRKLVYLIILLIPIGELGRVQIMGNVVVHPGDVVLGITVLLWLFIILKNRKFSIFKTFLTKPLFIFVGICLLSLLVGARFLTIHSFLIALLYPVRFCLYAMIFFIIKDFDKKSKMNVVKLLVVSATVIVAGGIVQYFLYPNLRNLYYLGWDEHLYRLFSSFLDPNFAALFISLFLTLLFALLFAAKDKRARFALGVISLFSFIALLLTYSRTGYLMFGVCVLILFLLLKKYIIPVVALIILAIGLFLIPKNSASEGAHLFRVNSLYARGFSDENALTIFSQNPILGVGFNAYEFASQRYKLTKPSLYPNHAAAGTDNSFLLVLATTGIVGFLSFIYLQWAIIAGVFLQYKNSRPRSLHAMLCLAFLVSLVGLWVSSLFINSLFYSFIMEWMWILLGLTAGTLL